MLIIILQVVEKSLELQNINLEDHFQRYGTNYNFVQGVIINFKWNTLLFFIQKQLDIDEELIKAELNNL